MFGGRPVAKVTSRFPVLVSGGHSPRRPRCHDWAQLHTSFGLCYQWSRHDPAGNAPDAPTQGNAGVVHPTQSRSSSSLLPAPPSDEILRTSFRLVLVCARAPGLAPTLGPDLLAAARPRHPSCAISSSDVESSLSTARVRLVGRTRGGLRFAVLVWRSGSGAIACLPNLVFRARTSRHGFNAGAGARAGSRAGARAGVRTIHSLIPSSHFHPE